MVLCNIFSELLANLGRGIHSDVAHDENFFKIVVELIGDILIFADSGVDSTRHGFSGLFQT